MIETIMFVAGIATVGASASTAGWLVGKRRGARDAESNAEQHLRTLATQRDAARSRAREALGESARLKALSLAAQPFSEAPSYTERPSPRDAEELARLLRGLMLIDDVTLADASGLALTREDTRSSADLAAIAPNVLASIRRLELASLGVSQIAFETVSADHVCARALTGRADGALLLVRTTSQRANPLAIDAVAHAAAKITSDPTTESAPSIAKPGSSERIAVDDPRLTQAFGVLERELGTELAAVVLAADGTPLLSAASKGPSVETRRAVSTELDSLQDRVARALRAVGMARVEVTLRGGDVITWSSLGVRSRLSILTFGKVGKGSSARLERLIGAVRRAIGSGVDNFESMRGTP